MRTINVSTEVFAAIWSNRQLSEESEDTILRRILNCSVAPTDTNDTSDEGGVYIEQYDLRFPEGAEIFRTYKGKEYRARATKDGRWLLENFGETYPSLHKLSWAVVGGHENAWYAWKFLKSDGTEAFIDALRDESKVQRRVGRNG